MARIKTQFLILMKNMSHLISKIGSFKSRLFGSFGAIDCTKQLAFKHQVGLLDWFKRVHLLRSYKTFELVETDLRKNDKYFKFIMFFHIFNTIRWLVYIFLPEYEPILKYLGCLTQYYGGKRHLLIIPFFSYGLNAIHSMLRMNYSKISRLEWLKIFSVLNGNKNSSMIKIRITNEKRAKRLIQFSAFIDMVVNCCLVVFPMFGLLFYFSLAYFNLNLF